MNWSEKAQAIKAIVLDIDGVLTDGMIGYSDTDTIKFFNVKDGHAIKMAMRTGLLVGILSGREDDANRRRAEELNLSFVYVGEKDKREAFERLLREQKLKAEECLYVGDDLPDIPAIRRSGIGVCVADSPAEVARCADWQTTLPGGRGAVRETIVRLLTEQHRWESAMEKYVSDIQSVSS
jgi:3-deoxy-D-manno-octulosonate 8-phosphate phosphatase (KDO 8-P phosphatase)